MEQSPAKQTPMRKRSRRQSDSDDEFVMEESPTKKARAPTTPSKTAQRRAEAAQRKQWEIDWERSIVGWKDDPEHPYEQVLNSFEIHKSDAMSFYNLLRDEMGTLPHWKFRNDYNPLTPGRSYSHEGVKMLVARKHAMLWDVHEQDIREEIMLKEGWRLFNES